MPRYTPGIVKVMGELSLSFSVLPPKFDHVIFSLAAKFHLFFYLKKDLISPFPGLKNKTGLLKTISF
jgi:hypothetical protein